jgi:hypothetical protein
MASFNDYSSFGNYGRSPQIAAPERFSLPGTQWGGQAPQQQSPSWSEGWDSMNLKAQNSIPGINGSPVFDGGGNSLMGTLFGTKDAKGMQTMGAAMPALSLLQGLMSYGNARETNKIGRENLAFQKSSYNENMALQKASLNNQYSDQQRARAAANPAAFGGRDAFQLA